MDFSSILIVFSSNIIDHFLFLKVIIGKERTEALLLVKSEDKTRYGSSELSL